MIARDDDATLDHFYRLIDGMNGDQLDQLVIRALALRRGEDSLNALFADLPPRREGSGAQGADDLCPQLASICCKHEHSAWKSMAKRRHKAGDAEGMQVLRRLMQRRLQPGAGA